MLALCSDPCPVHMFLGKSDKVRIGDEKLGLALLLEQVTQPPDSPNFKNLPHGENGIEPQHGWCEDKIQECM